MPMRQRTIDKLIGLAEMYTEKIKVNEKDATTQKADVDGPME